MILRWYVRAPSDVLEGSYKPQEHGVQALLSVIAVIEELFPQASGGNEGNNNNNNGDDDNSFRFGWKQFKSLFFDHILFHWQLPRHNWFGIGPPSVGHNGGTRQTTGTERQQKQEMEYNNKYRVGMDVRELTRMRMA